MKVCPFAFLLVLVLGCHALAYPVYQSDDFVTNVVEKATGFFRLVQRADGRWWAIDPLGRGTFLRGVDHITYGGFYCAFTKRSTYHEANKVRFPVKADWETDTINRLKAWGFNMLGAGCDPALERRGLVHTGFVAIGESFCRVKIDDGENAICPFENKPCSAFPNVFHPQFAAFCDERARMRCAPSRDDPWLFGYFIDNELAWWGRTLPPDSGTGLYAAVAALPATHSAHLALAKFLAGRGKTVATATDADKLAFLRFAAEVYFRESCAAIRRHDPNHLVLGARFAGLDGANPVVWEVAGQYCDVVTFNCYPWADLDRGAVMTARPPRGERIETAFERVHSWVRKPMLITEWSFPALDAGLPCQYGAGQRFRTQALRVQATELFARTMLASPYFVGYDYFMWIDQPPEGFNASFRENTNYGLQTSAGDPYPDLIRMFTHLHSDVGSARLSRLNSVRKDGFGSTVMAEAFLDKFFPREPGVVCLRAQEGYVISNGIGLAVAMRTGDAPAFRTVQYRDVEIGSLGGLVKILRGNSPEWHSVESTTAAWCERAGRGTLVTRGRGEAGETTFEVDQELVVHPRKPWIFCNLVSVRNTGMKPLTLTGWFFRPYAAFTPVDASGRTKRTPKLWQGAMFDAWLSAADSRYWGGLSFAPSAEPFNFFLGRGNCQLPDAIFTPSGGNVLLKPGEAWKPNGAAWMLAICGSDGADGWAALVCAFENHAFNLPFKSINKTGER